MGRTKRNAVMKRDSNVPTKSSLESSENTQLCKKKDRKNKVKPTNESSFQCKDCVKELMIVLEDICKPSRVNERTVLGDKTNESPVLSNSRTQNMTSNKKCVYAKVKRDSLENKILPPEEKMAEYEFEVDENESLVKVKKKKNKCKRKILSPDQEYVPKGKIKIGETVKHNEVLRKKTLKSKPAILKVDNSEDILKNKNISKEILPSCSSQSVTNGRKVLVENNSSVERSKTWNTPQRSNLKHLEDGDKKSPSSASSLFRYQAIQKLSDLFEENASPVVRAKDSKTPQMLMKDWNNDFSEMEVSDTENSCQIDFRVVKETPRPSQEQSLIEELDTSMEIHAMKNESNDESVKFSSPVGVKKSTNIVRTYAAKNLPTSESQQGLHVTESTSLHNDKTEDDFQTSFDSSVNHYTNRPLPRVSGIHHQICEESGEKWNLDNCFGFRDDIEETEIVIQKPEISLRKRLRRTSPISSTPLITNKKSGKIERLSTFFRKRELTPTVMSPKSAQTERKFIVSRKIEPLPSPATVVHSPFSNPLKQAKLDFTSNKSSNCGTPKPNDEESPLLFKSAEDKTPVHFKEPPRRSYIRTVRKKMKPIGDEWIEIDSDSDEDELVSKKSIKRTKKVKQNKQEEREASKWIKCFNDQCEEIEDFELCVE